MKPMKSAQTIVLTCLCLFAGTASAHPGGHALTGFGGGLAHPLLGLDHLLAMIAIGLWAAQQGGRALWAVPAAFVGAMAAGGGLALTGLVEPGLALPQVGLVSIEGGIAASVLVLGLLIATQRRWAVTTGMAIAACFALFHGYAHGQEMPQAVSPALYAAGFVLTTVFLHGVGIAGSLVGRYAMRAAGFGIAASGLAMLLGA